MADPGDTTNSARHPEPRDPPRARRNRTAEAAVRRKAARLVSAAERLPGMVDRDRSEAGAHPHG